MFCVSYEKWDPFTEEETCPCIPCATREEAESVSRNLSNRGFCNWIKEVSE